MYIELLNTRDTAEEALIRSICFGEKDGDPYFQYSAMLANGEYQESKPDESPWAHSAGDSIYGSFEPYFEGASAVYKITNITADTMTMRDSVGEITMTRSW